LSKNGHHVPCPSPLPFLVKKIGGERPGGYFRSACINACLKIAKIREKIKQELVMIVICSNPKIDENFVNFFF